jgi:hypothetical protein
MKENEIETWIAERGPELALVLVLVARRLAARGVGLPAVAGAVFRAFDLSLESLDVRPHVGPEEPAHAE